MKVLVNVLPMDIPSLNTSLEKSDPLNILHENNKVLTPDGGSVIFCPHVRDANDISGDIDIDGGTDGGDMCGSPMKR